MVPVRDAGEDDPLEVVQDVVHRLPELRSRLRELGPHLTGAELGEDGVGAGLPEVPAGPVGGPLEGRPELLGFDRQDRATIAWERTGHPLRPAGPAMFREIGRWARYGLAAGEDAAICHSLGGTTRDPDSNPHGEPVIARSGRLSVAFVSTSLPRRCGIASYTAALIAAHAGGRPRADRPGRRNRRTPHRPAVRSRRHLADPPGRP